MFQFCEFAAVLLKTRSKLQSFFLHWCFFSIIILHLPNIVDPDGNHVREDVTSHWFFKMAAIQSKIYFRLLPSGVVLGHSLRNVEIYLYTKFRLDISLRGWVITTSGFRERTFTILELYFWFWFWPIHGHGYGILHAKLHPNWSTPDRVITSILQDGGR